LVRGPIGQTSVERWQLVPIQRVFGSMPLVEARLSV